MLDAPGEIHSSAAPLEEPVSLRACIRAGLRMAALLTAWSSLLAAAMFVAALIVDRRIRRDTIAMLEVMPVVAAAYLAAGTLGPTVYWIVAPLRRSFAGWIVSGILAAAAVYGSVGVVSALAYVTTGNGLLEYESRAEAWTSIAPNTAILALASGIPLGLWLWSRSRPPAE